MVMSFAFVVCQVKVVDWPCPITFGLAASVAVGAAGGGGGGVTCATFLLQAASKSMADSAAMKANILNSPLVMSSSLVGFAPGMGTPARRREIYGCCSQPP
jgi:hypothetical protein